MTDSASSLTFSGERFTPETPGEIAYEHWHRYWATLPLARGRKVLDAACGEGYGTAILAQAASEAIGVDIADEAVAHARKRYGREGLSFRRESVTAMSLDDASVDLVVSFETIEHLEEQAAMLAEFRRVLRPDGLLIISSPNRPVYSDERNFRNDYHVRELDREELRALLTPGFPRQLWYGQRLLFHSMIWPEAPVSGVDILAQDGDAASAVPEPAPPMYFIVVCGGKDAKLPQARALSLYADRSLAIYREFERTTQAERKLYAKYLEQEKELEERQRKLAAAYAEYDAMHIRMRALHENWKLISADLEERSQGLRSAQHELSAAHERIDAVQSEMSQKLEAARADLAACHARIDDLHRDLGREREALQEAARRLADRESLRGWLQLPFAKLRTLLGARSA
jgi:SAM-dependent methyltransferase